MKELHDKDQEGVFFAVIAPKIQAHKIIMNSQKNDNRSAFSILLDGKPADLKIQSEPHFLVDTPLDVNPSYTITLSEGDYERYTNTSSDTPILFWINWEKTEYIHEKTKILYKASEVNEVRLTTTQQIKTLVENKTINCFQSFDRTEKESIYYFDRRQIPQIWEKDRRLYAITFEDGTTLDVVDQCPRAGEIDTEIVDAIKTLKQALKAQIIGSEHSIL